ncbi:MAG: NAD(P)/FAD-dependent oxidoreductase [Alphaproteobacteria bacterium]|nr:NAD(P)/FAD-dependent oxidoreductase [Alphaproteobacteria bacterium]
MKDYDAIVIGSGAGGMTAAVAMARAGQRVLVLEQHYLPGGWCHSFPLGEGNWLFSPGVHYVGELDRGGDLRRIYEGLGMADDLEFMELSPDGFDHLRVGDRTLDVPKGRERFRDRLKGEFPQHAGGIDRYVDTVAQIYEALMQGARARRKRDMPALLWRMRNVLRHGLTSVDRFLDRCGITDPHLRAFLSLQAGDHGMSPERAPFALHAAVQGHYFGGAYYPRGGARSIPKAYIKQLRAHGGEIRMRTTVSRILIEGGRAIGVRLEDGSEIRADLVVSNADPGVTWGRLVGAEHTPRAIRRRLDRTRWSISALSLFFATRADLRAQGLDSGNYWYARRPDVGEAYRFAKRASLAGVPELPGAFLTITTLKDPTKLKDGVHTGEAFSFVSPRTFDRWEQSAHGARPGAYEAFKARLVDRMFDTLEEVHPGLRDGVVFAELGTPLTNVHYLAATQGNLYGIEKSLRNLGPFGFPIKSPVEGLFQCGQSTSGHGVMGVTQSGLSAAAVALGVSRRELLTGRGELRTFLADDPTAWPARMKKHVHAA